MIGFVDVAIPLGIGLFLIVSPQSFTKKTPDPVENDQRYAKLRKIGYILLGVAALYAAIKLVSTAR